MISSSCFLAVSLLIWYMVDTVEPGPLPPPAPEVVVFAAPQTQVNSKQIYPGGGGGGFGGGGGGFGGGGYGGGGYGGAYPGPGNVGAYGEMEYDDGYNNGYGYGARAGSQRTAYSNYLAYYGIGLYNNGNAGLGRSGCLQRCRLQGRVNCALVCRSYG